MKRPPIAGLKSCATLFVALAASACASAPPVPAVKVAPGPSFEQKMAWILRLEDQRMLRDPAPVPAPPPPPPDLARLLTDDEARIRRRAALAIGHVALADGVPPLLGGLGDPDPEVRQ